MEKEGKRIAVDFGSKQISTERVEIPRLHEHPLIPFTRFVFHSCKGCRSLDYIYGGYRCNETGYAVVFHKECARPLQEIYHASHPDHPLKLIILDSEPSTCFCGKKFEVGYCCSICDFNLDLECARRPEPLVIPENSYGHEHPLKLVCGSFVEKWWKKICTVCEINVDLTIPHYRCQECEFVVHVHCLDIFPEAYHTSHPRHLLRFLRGAVPDYADNMCLLCKEEFDQEHHQLHHCDVCNVSICRACVKNPPPVDVECLKTHEHQLHLLPKRIDFICDACGMQGDRSPYCCLQCNFMIHRDCIDLPRVIYINRHDHRIAYTPCIGHGDWKCIVCRRQVDGIYGAYTCWKCPTFAVHARCATSKYVWDMDKTDEIPEDEYEMPVYEVIDYDSSIKHFSHDHHLYISKDGTILAESTLCVACVFQIISEPFYSCKECDFYLHEKCACLPRKKRSLHNETMTLRADSLDKVVGCGLCEQMFTGFRYESYRWTLDVRCASDFSDFVKHGSHPHPLYYEITDKAKPCSGCGKVGHYVLSCVECDFRLDFKCVTSPEKVMVDMYDDHPLVLMYGESNVDGEYWCDACETKRNPEKWFYACNHCEVKLHFSCVVGAFSYMKPGVRLHFSCVVGDFSYMMPGSGIDSDEEVVSNTSIIGRPPLCYMCNSRCKLPSFLKKSSNTGVDVYFCSLECRSTYNA